MLNRSLAYNTLSGSVIHFFVDYPARTLWIMDSLNIAQGKRSAHNFWEKRHGQTEIALYLHQRWVKVHQLLGGSSATCPWLEKPPTDHQVKRKRDEHPRYHRLEQPQPGPMHGDRSLPDHNQRFLMVKERQEPSKIHVVLNWFEELKHLVPTWE